MSTTIDSALEHNHAKVDKKPTANHQKQADAYLEEIKQFEQDRVEIAKKTRRPHGKSQRALAFSRWFSALRLL